MLWFRIATVSNVTAVLAWSTGIAAGIIKMCQEGAELQSMLEDPSKNGTLSNYVGVCIVEILIIMLSVFALFLAFQMWQNNYQIDHALRQQFIVWLGGSAVMALLCLCCGVYMLIRGKDNQENMARLYDSFQKYSQETTFVSTFEKYQRENQCCGIYTPDDWLMLQLRQMPTAGGGGGGYQSLDYGFRQNPSTGKCHMQPPTIPPGCGIKMMDEINFQLKVYAALCLVEVLLILSSAGFAAYCFFYWLERDVIVIPEDEVSNVVIIEPESGSTIILDDMLTSSEYLTRSGYLKSYSGMRSGRISGSRYLGRQSRYLQSDSRVIHMTHTEILHEQERALQHEFGGKVLAEMHLDHKSTKMLKPEGSKEHHATVALVRNRHPPEKKDLFHTKGHHGQTGNLAQDIADMSGGSAKDFIEDVYIPPGTSRVIEIPLDPSRSRILSPERSGSGLGGQQAHNAIEGVLEPGQHKKMASEHHHHPHGHHHGHHTASTSHHHHHGSKHFGSTSHHHNHGSKHFGSTSHHHHHHDSKYFGSTSNHGHHHHHHHDGYLEDGGHHHGSHAEHGRSHHDSYMNNEGHHHHQHHDHHHHHGLRSRESHVRSHHSHHHNGNNSHHHHDHHGHHDHRDHHDHHGHHDHHDHHGHHDHHQHHGQHGHHHHHRSYSRDLSRPTTVLFRNPRPMETD